MRNGKKSYNFSDKTHTSDGKISVCLGVAAVILFLFMALYSIFSKGNAGVWVGFLGVFDVFLALLGLIFSVVGLRQEDSLKLLPRIGFFCSGIVLVLLLLLLVVGLLF